MDEFAKEYFEKLKILAKEFESRRRELAKSRIKMFVACLTRLVVNKEEKFDLILGSGNSGLFMTRLAVITYEKLNIPPPPVLCIPLFRYAEDGKTIYDNSMLLPEIKKEIDGFSDIKNILFVDDEIMRGITLKGCLDLVLQSNENIQHIDVTIIAEHHFFEWHYTMSKVSTRFFSYSPLIQGLNGTISYFLPGNIFQMIVSSVGGLFSYTHAMAVFAAGAIKRRDDDGKGYFDYSSGEILQRLHPDYVEMRALLLVELEGLVEEGVKEYKDGRIKFRF